MIKTFVVKLLEIGVKYILIFSRALSAIYFGDTETRHQRSFGEAFRKARYQLSFTQSVSSHAVSESDPLTGARIQVQ